MEIEEETQNQWFKQYFELEKKLINIESEDLVILTEKMAVIMSKSQNIPLINMISLRLANFYETTTNFNRQILLKVLFSFFKKNKKLIFLVFQEMQLLFPPTSKQR